MPPMTSRDNIIALNARAIAADTEYPEHFDLAFAAPDTAQEIAALEALLNIRIPDELRSLYQECGAFRHVHYDESYSQTIALDAVGAVLERLRNPGQRWYSCHAGQGLIDFVYAKWGGRTDLDDILSEATVKVVNDNYTGFGCRYINDDVHDYWYFDRNGMFGNLRFDQDELHYNSWKIESLCDVLPPDDLVFDAAQRRAYVLAEIVSFSEPQDTFPGMTLAQLVDSQFAAIVAALSPRLSKHARQCRTSPAAIDRMLQRALTFYVMYLYLGHNMSKTPSGMIESPHRARSKTMEMAMKQMLEIEQALLRRPGSVGVSSNLLPPDQADGVPVMRMTIEGLEELPVFITATPSQVLCICYLWTEAEIRPERRYEMLEAMMDLNMAIPLSNFGRVGEHYVIFGSLAHDASADSIATDVAMVADNAFEALDVFSEFLK
ncbi:DUF2170 family protein [Massilia sp. CCM 8734]|nr:DUF2170 family protein [Massilia sp. CCM 8734]